MQIITTTKETALAPFDLAHPVYPIFQDHDYSTSNNLKMVQHRAMFTMANQ